MRQQVDSHFEDLDEHILFHEDQTTHDRDDDDEPEQSLHTHDLGSPGAVDIAGTQSGSAKSVTLNVVLEEQDVLPGPTVNAARPSSRLVAHAFSSHGMNNSTMKMGSSVPIAIPTWARPMPSNPRSPTAVAPATFVPPHTLLPQRNDFAFSLVGESPAGGMKRDRLRMRNSILKQTGFLEREALLPGMVAGVGIVSGGAIGQAEVPTTFTPVRAGGLAQALGRSSPAVTAIYD